MNTYCVYRVVRENCVSGKRSGDVKTYTSLTPLKVGSLQMILTGDMSGTYRILELIRKEGNY